MKKVKTLFVFILILSSFGLANQPKSTQTTVNPYLLTGSFVGQVQNSDIFIAIVITNNEILAYVCDGVEVAEWFRGSMPESGWLELISKKGWKLQASMSRSSAIGSLVMENSKPMAFLALPAEGKAGLYRASSTKDGIKYVGGWIVNANGDQRGAVIGGGTFQAEATLDVQTLQAEMIDLETLTTQIIIATHVEFVTKP